MRTVLLLSVAATAALVTTSGNAAIMQVSTSHNIEYQQTAAGVVTPVGTFFTADILTSSGDPSTTGSLSIPGIATPQPLALVAPNDIGFETNFLGNQTALDTAYPTGDYGFTAGGSTFVSNIPGTLYTSTIPEIANFDAFTTLDPTKSFTVDLASGFAPQGTESFTFFTIVDQATDMPVYNAGFFAPSATSFTIGANTLMAGHSYAFETIFDNRYSIENGVDPAAFHLFDVRTDGSFTLAAGVPEPASWAMMLAGFGLVGGTLRSRRKAIVRFG